MCLNSYTFIVDDNEFDGTIASLHDDMLEGMDDIDVHAAA